MFTTQHSIEVKANINDAYELCRDVTKWPELFPPCISANIVKQNGNEQVITISARANESVMNWESVRKLIPDQRTIKFEQIKPSSLLKDMKGVWRFFPTKQGVLINLEHQFSIKEDVKGLVHGIDNSLQAVEFMKRSVNENSVKELNAIKEVLEKKDSMENSQGRKVFKESVIMKAPVEKIYRLLRDADKWPEILPHCEAMEVLYDDGENQELIMTVKVRGENERIRTIRHCSPNRLISYFQPNPPPVLTAHIGQWLLEPQKDEVVVTSQHEVSLNPQGIAAIWGDVDELTALERVKNAINENSRTTMKVIENYLKGQN